MDKQLLKFRLKLFYILTLIFAGFSTELNHMNITELAKAVLIILIYSFIMSWLIFKINHPEATLNCLRNKHHYTYAGTRSGMVLKPDNTGVIGTERRIYICQCGKEKPAEDEDYI